MDPITVITALGAALKVVDQVANQIDRFVHKKPEPSKEPTHKVIAEKTADTIEVKREGKVVEVITADDIKKLDENSRKLIKALEDSMQNNYDLWAKVYPRRDNSPDPVVNAQIDAQLNDIAKKMCSDLNKIFRYLNSIGKHLDDHYAHVQFVCGELGNS
jgi:hypothetical protein